MPTTRPDTTAKACQLALVIPVYNEDVRADEFLANLIAYLTRADHPSLKKYRFEIVLVDDGSRNPYDPGVASAVYGNVRVHLLRHPVNLGQGAALETGIQFARDRLHCESFVTMDSDGQHRPEDLPSLITALERGDVDIVFGNRFAGAELSVPFPRRVILRLALLFEIVVTRIRVGDSHNGFRALNRRAALCFRLKQARMAHATEIKQIVARNRLKYTEAPVRVAYTDASLAKGQRDLDLIVILRDLLDVYLFRNG